MSYIHVMRDAAGTVHTRHWAHRLTAELWTDCHMTTSWIDHTYFIKPDPRLKPEDVTCLVCLAVGRY
jgi:hypothetical protein